MPPPGYTEVLQENHYYPFGMNMDGPWRVPQGADGENFYQYNGKELNNDIGLGWHDYGARWYDAAIGRWGAVDPLAELFLEQSVYQYGFNSPILMVDPNGMAARPAQKIDSRGLFSNEELKENLTNAIDNLRRSDNSDGEECCPDPVEGAGKGILNNAIDVFMYSLGVANPELWTGEEVVPRLDVEDEEVTGYIAGTLLFIILEPTPAGEMNAFTKASSRVLTWGKNANGKLVKHRGALGYGHLSAQEAQKILPQLRAAANQLINGADPALTRVGQWHQHNNAVMYISNGKMVVTESNGTFITLINKTSNNWYELAK